jgi:hypothetical protein
MHTRTVGATLAVAHDQRATARVAHDQRATARVAPTLGHRCLLSPPDLQVGQRCRQVGFEIPYILDANRIADQSRRHTRGNALLLSQLDVAG